ncbi:DUF3549 family protein [Halomonas nitroreducens]|uniref:DUF3549 family protein n=1 Tax=Halomonas nitroreducens TaxID=447425 RepID=A0A431V3M3_9GAMM|nr:DUF3549 family protein [Halomonas nitroreducens]RTR02412.1 DUF3549 family protein [Halomonas nitroreducens]
MQPIDSLHDFFVRTGAEVRLYHLGRRVEPCPLEDLAALEAGQRPWPQPWQGKARLAMVFRVGELEDPLIWFLALPLDEQGQLDPAPRDAFLQRLLETLGRNVQGLGRGDGEQIDNLMKDNPLAFTPSLPFQALLHARASRDLGRPASQHLEPVEAYLEGQQTLDWRALGLQGLADFAVRMDPDQASRLAARLPALPGEVLTSLCYCLEHVAIDEGLATALRARGEAAAEAGDVEIFCACVRAVAGAESRLAGAWFDDLLGDPEACGPDLLAAMAGRGWRHLEDGERLPRFLTRLAEAPQADFTAVARDLALIPRLRLPVLMTLREAAPDSPIGRRLAGLSR